MAEEFTKQFAIKTQKLDSCAASVKRVYNYAKGMNIQLPENITIYKGMLKQLDDFYSSFMSTSDELSKYCILNDKPELYPTADHKKNMDNVFIQYSFAAGKGESLSTTSQPDLSEALKQAAVAAATAATTAMHESTAHSSKKIRFPKIQLPTFDGEKFTDWPTYRDTYESLVHDEDYSNIEKFHCLIRSLSGTASRLIKHIQVSDDNYEQAWSLLKKHYNNKRKLASSYIHGLLDFSPSLQKKSQTDILKEFLLNVSENVSAFNNIIINNRADYILFELAVRNLDHKTREAFPTFDSLKEFVESRYLALTMMDSSKDDRTLSFKPGSKSSPALPSPNKLQPKSGRPSTSTVLITNQNHKSVRKPKQPPYTNVSKTFNSEDSQLKSTSCFFCNKGFHILRNCDKFLSLSPSERLNHLRDWNGCKNCLHPYHKTSLCKSKYRCAECEGLHNTKLHISKSSIIKPNLSRSNNGSTNVTKDTPTQPNVDPNSPTLTGTTMTAVDHSSEALLGTIEALIQDGDGIFKPIRMVVDSGSQFSLITQECVNRLHLKPREYRRSIRGVGSYPAFQTLGKTSCVIRSRSSSLPEFHPEAVVVPNITHLLPQTQLPRNIRLKYTAYDLADPKFWEPGPIDFLIGADMFCDIISGVPISVDKDEPRLLRTVFGHVIIGQLPLKPYSPICGITLAVLSADDKIETIMNRFWEVEEIDIPVSSLSPEEKFCEDHFTLTHSRLPSGHYSVSYAFKPGSPPSCFPSSKQQALSRLYSLETKLRKNPAIRKDYNDFMEQYLQLGHMKPSTEPGAFHIPHHPVYKLDVDGNPKIRVVFDASSKTSAGSLNSHLLPGPKLQNDISAILLRFRRHRVVFSCDVVKMFRNILINKEDQKYQHILWRSDPQLPVQEFTLLTVTYGTTPAPYQSQRTLKQLVLDESPNFPLAVEVLTNDVYIDDVVTGADTIEEAILLKNQIVGIFAAGLFTLSKWTSNCPLLLSDVSDETTSSPVSFDDLESSIKILGLHWDPVKDDFSYNVVIPDLVLTKRAILSAIGRLYDPLGYLGPVTFLAKTVLQETWKPDLGWDDEVPPNLQKIWKDFLDDLPNLTNIKIPRYIERDQTSHCSVFGFADASSKGCCAALYLRVQSSNSSKLYLLRSKTKLAPIKTLTIPRLELIAALLLAQLYSSSKDYLEYFNIESVNLFTDAAIVLGWLKTLSYQLKTFIANRVVKILDITEIIWWRHIPTGDNPADCGSRGLLPSQLVYHSLWWHGPSWIHHPVDEWPSTINIAPPDELPELKSTVSSLVSTDMSSGTYSDLVSITEKFSSYTKLIRVVSYILRFTYNTSISKERRRTGAITAEEFSNANLTIIRGLQNHYYPEAFTKNRKWSALLSSLRTFIDDQGLLRVGGRIRKSGLPFEQKHPLLLPRRSHFTNILIDFYHKSNLHVGPSALQAIINHKYWIPSSKNLIKQRKRLCITCTRFSKRHFTPHMGELPAIRFTEVRPFYVTGVDFAGPFLVKETTRRNSPTSKAYLSLFVCLSTKALYLELVNALTTEAFIDALEIFISRRGSPSLIISDRGTNFVGASNYLKEIEVWINQDQTKSDLLTFGANCGIKWKFQPPSSPHFGGLYEAGVKSVKSLLVKTLGAQPYQVSQLRTIFAKIEAVLNSRPLYPTSSDPTDLQPLTPAHILIGGPLTPLIEEDLSHIPSNRLSHWQQLRERVQTFWKRWRSDYLLTLQRRNKWIKDGESINVGEMVLVSDTNHMPYSWPLARIVDIHPGDDGVVRVVTLRTATGTYKRPVVKLIPLRHITNNTSASTSTNLD